MIPTAPGVYPGLPMADYLAIPALSSGVATTLLTECALKALHESHLNLHPQAADDTEEKDTGTIVHSIVLEGDTSGIEIIDPTQHLTEKTGNVPVGWGNKSIRTARDFARDAGKIPILKPKWAAVESMAGATQAFIASLRDSEAAIYGAFQPDCGDSELTMVWEEGTTLCKARCDRIDRARCVIINLKTTKSSVQPDAWGRGQLLDYYVGGAFYVRGAYACFGVEPAHVYLCQETVPPYLCSLVGLSPQWLAIGNQKVKAATREWARCVASGKFPGYPNRVAYPELPPWEELRWNERQINDGIDYGSQA